MAAEDLPSEFDVVILGTGLCESVVAAAFSRVGQKVLHLDSSSYYAANWASFTFNGLLSWIQEQQEEPKPAEAPDWSSLCEEGEELVYLSASPQPSVRNIQVFCFTSEEDEEEDEGPNTTEEEPAAKDSEETKEEEPSDGGEEAAETEGAGLEADQPITEEPPTEPEPTKKKKRISYKQLVKEGRRFNIDLVSKLLYSRGSLVDLLIKSNVSRYAEFKNVTRILTYRSGRVEQVPCSRADVFSSRQLSVIEKRKLMRFLTSCLDDTQDQSAYNGRPYLEFLSDQNLGENLQHFLFHSISMATEATPTEVGLAATRHFLQCLGRYGNTPFLFPVYGLGEIPQCFCRMCAVFGGIYCLRHSVSALLKDKDTNRCKAVIDSRGQRISCSHFIVEEGYVEAGLKREATPPRFLSRAVLITDGSILPTDSDQQVSMVTVPPIERESPSVKMVELCSSTMTCMAGTYLVHLTCSSVGSAYEDLSPLVTRMFNTTESDDQVSRPSVLWCVYFNMADGAGLEVKGHDLPTNVHLCSGPDAELGAERAVRQAESIFKEILPEEDFCPPAPNPEDILYDAEPGTTEEERAAGTTEEETEPGTTEEERAPGTTEEERAADTTEEERAADTTEEESMATEQGTDSNETDTNEQEETASGLQEEKQEEEEGEKGEGPIVQTEE